MKRCPECRRDYYDDSLLYCLDDGSTLLEGPASGNEPATAILHETAPPSEAATRAHIHTTAAEAASEKSPQGTVGKKQIRAGKPLLILLGFAAIFLGGFFGYRYVTQAKQIESIAVMPFVNESGSQDVEYLSDGMTETLIRSLSNLPNLNVKPRSSVFRYKGKDADTKAIAKELNVQAILNGRVAQRGDQLTLDLELIDGQKDSVIWSEYNRKQSDLVSLQSEVARDVSTKLKSKLSGAEVAKVEKKYTADPEAYQFYLKGRYQWNRRTGEALRQAASLYQQAIAKDPSYALAYAGLAQTYLLFSSYDVAPATDSMPQAKAAALRALEIDDSLAEAHTALGFYLDNYEWARESAHKEFQRAIELDSNYATAHHWYSTALSNVKRFDEALAELRRAEELDPLSQIIGTNLGDTLAFARRYDEAIAQFKRTLVRDQNFAYGHIALSQAYGYKGMYSEAIAESRTAVELGFGASAKGSLAYWLAISGKRGEAMKLLSELKAEATQAYVQADSIGMIYLALGDKAEALDWLEKHMLSHAETANQFSVLPVYDDIRGEPRFKEMLKRMNLPE